MRPRKLVPLASRTRPPAGRCRLRLAATADPPTTARRRRRHPAAALDLKGVCPDTVVIQTDWFPEAEHGAPLPAARPGLHRSTPKQEVADRPAGRLRRRTPASRSRSAPAARRSASRRSARRCTRTSRSPSARSTPTRRSRTRPSSRRVAVVAPLEISPLMIMWDTDGAPGLQHDRRHRRRPTPRSSTSRRDAYMRLPDRRRPGPGQPDRRLLRRHARPASSPSSGDDRQAGLRHRRAVHLRERAARAVVRSTSPTAHQRHRLPDLPRGAAIRAEDKDKLAPCLKKLVPIIQQATVDFIDQPGRDQRLIDLERRRRSRTSGRTRRAWPTTR